MEVKGWDAIKEASKAFFESAKGAKAEFLETNYKVAGDVVIGWGKWIITFPDSAATKLYGRFTDVKTKRDGKWVYIFDHGSVPLPAAPQTTAQKN
jgi:ketosteroid isomerase-like protein